MAKLRSFTARVEAATNTLEPKSTKKRPEGSRWKRFSPNFSGALFPQKGGGGRRMFLLLWGLQRSSADGLIEIDVCFTQCTWMSQEVSKRIVSGL